jgi:S1-C subfamily serine protease
MSNENLLAGLSAQMADAVETIGRSLVTVNGRERQSATGIVYAAELVLTADHVVERDDNLTVGTADGRTLSAQLAGRDASTDLAVLRVPGLVAPAAETSAARVGQIALAVGRPSAEGLSASAGIVSAISGPVRMGRSAQIDRIIRTDAIPYPGFSGGALTAATGAAYGLLTTGLARGVAAVIPMDIALRVAQTLTQQGYVKRGYLGVVTQQVKVPPAQRAGLTQDAALLVMKVEEGGPAEQGGLMIGDLLISLDGQPIGDADDLLGLLTGERVGKRVDVHVLRGGQRTPLSVVVGQKS